MGFINEMFGGLLNALNSVFGYGLAIIIFTFISRAIFIYFSGKGKKSSLQMQRLQPKIKELAAKHKNDRAKLQQAQQALYQAEGINPMSGCLWGLLPFPIMIILYEVLRNPLQYILGVSAEGFGTLQDIVRTMKGLAADAPLQSLDVAAFAADKNNIPQIVEALGGSGSEIAQQIYVNGSERLAMDQHFLGFDLFGVPNESVWPLIIIPILAAGLTFLSIWLSQKWSGVEQQSNMKFMSLLMPAVTFFFAYSMPVGIGLYWVAGSLFAIGQDYFLTKHYRKVLDAEDAKRAELAERKKAAGAAMKEELRQRRAEEIASGKKKNTTYRLKQKPNQDKKKK